MFNKRKNKTFNYTSRFSKNDLKAKKTQQDITREIDMKWKRNRKTGSGKKKLNLLVLLVLLAIIIAIMYYLEYKL